MSKFPRPGVLRDLRGDDRRRIIDFFDRYLKASWWSFNIQRPPMSYSHSDMAARSVRKAQVNRAIAAYWQAAATQT
jgi:hypothetical protein